ncbi:DUF2726 domain-containing protein [Paludibacterium denitrificans]|uniref:DUF2726 domain-containing protein n=1 Tax=Paludibacterium denitrificans TaxID=2675226 RepID=UPI001E2B98F1|nr:DUF2726 domain-containing protein [Paludibacterium denitrificans]
MVQLLREALSEAPYRALTCHAQVLLNQVASSTNPALAKDELDFMRNRASCDFVLYFKVGKTPLGVIEVDGGSHDRPEQATRDALKNSILAKSDIPILRLRTIESHIEEKIDGFLAQWASSVANV